MTNKEREDFLSEILQSIRDARLSEADAMLKIMDKWESDVYAQRSEAYSIGMNDAMENER